MSTYLGWNVVVIPSYPPAPASFQATAMDVVAMSISPFSGQAQIHDWNANWTEASVTMPAMQYSDAQNWVTFLKALKGVACVFQFGTAFGTAYPEIGTRYWRLKGNPRQWSVNANRYYGIQFDIREAI